MQMALRRRADTFTPLRLDTDVLRVGATQSLDLWRGELVSNFTLASDAEGAGSGARVRTRTVCHMDLDVLSWRVESDVLHSRADNISAVVLRIAFPYGSEAEYGGGADWGQDGKHTTTVVRTTNDSALLRRRLDWDEYEVLCRWGGAGVQGAKLVRDGWCFHACLICHSKKLPHLITSCTRLQAALVFSGWRQRVSCGDVVSALAPTSPLPDRPRRAVAGGQS